MGRVWPVSRLCELYLDICLTTEEKVRKNHNQGCRRVPDTLVTADRTSIIIKNKKEKTRDNTRRQKCCAKGSGKETKIQEFMYRDTRMWNLKCKITPVITGATGIVTKV